MWKVLVVVCALGNPCTMFVEDPMKYYSSESECEVAADVKARGIISTLEDYGYHIESGAHSCQYIFDQNEV